MWSKGDTGGAPRSSASRGARGVAGWAVLVGLAASLGCFLFRDAVNQSPAIRWWLFSNFGASRFCPELLRRSAPLRLTSNGNVVGRMFPTGCAHRVDDARQTLTLEFSGTGYAWTPLAGRVGFSARAGVEYRPDFSLQEDATYVWARTQRLLFPTEFRVGSIENKLVDWAQHQSPIGYLANLFGSQIASGQLSSGFTVVRTEDGDAFTLGLLQPPERPPAPFGAGGDDRLLVASETTETRPEQVDFIGPVIVTEANQQAFFKYRATGPAAEVLVFSRRDADLWRERLQTGAPLDAPPVPPLLGFPLTPGSEREQRLPLPPGQYVLVIDHATRVGAVRPPYNPLNALGANALVLAYRLEIGEAS